MLSSKMNKAKIKGQSPYQVPGSIAPQGAPQQPQGPDMRGLFAQQFERPEMTWSDKLGLLSGMMQDYSGVLGNDNADRAQARYDQRVGQEREDFEGNRNQQLMMAAAGGDPFALGMLDPIGNRAFEYGREQDEKADALFERQWLRDEGRYESEQEFKERSYLDSRDDRRDDVDFRERSFNSQEAARRASAAGASGEFGLSPIYGRDAEGNRILIQTNKAGGVQQAKLPEGVTLEDDLYKAAASGLGKGQADLILQRSKRESGLDAARAEFLNLEQTIDRAIKQTNSSNTGFLGNLNPFAVNLNATMKTLKANAAFTTLQEMRNNSPTGGALGQVSERELDLLMAAAAALERSQNQGQLDANLAAFKEKLRGSMMRLERAFEQDYNSGLFSDMTVESARARTFGGGQSGGGSDLPPGFEIVQ